MKLKTKLALTHIGDEFFAVPVGKGSDRSCMIRLNETGYDVMQGLVENQTPEEISFRLAQKYEVTQEHALQSVQRVIGSLRGAGLLEEEAQP